MPITQSPSSAGQPRGALWARVLLSGMCVVATSLPAGTTAVRADSAPAARAQYVAMGSSFASGPGILPRVAGAPASCARSAENYAHVLAKGRGLSLVDVSCSGATTVDVLKGGQFLLPPQLDAVTADTQLVTVTIGGNDVFYMANLMARSCDPRSSQQQALRAGCTPRPDALVEERFASLGESLRQIVVGVRSRSPRAQVVFVNYFSVLPEQGTCARVHLSAADATHMRTVATRLAQVTQQAASQSGATLLDVAELSRGHDACSPDPWVQGARSEGSVRIPPFHPTQAAMRAVGEALSKLPEIAALSTR